MIAKKFSFALILAILAACASLPRLDLGAIRNSELNNLNVPESNALASGQPTKEQIKVLADAGVKHIISLRRPDEIDWDERAVVEANGMEFHSIPVAGLAGVTKANAAKLEDLLNSLGDSPVLVHCGSSNRVGALKTLASLEGTDSDSIEAAFANGKRWGLTRLEEPLREKIEQGL
ncbi:MAG: sulfur transferase domain-containing protein [Pseudohongiellaceae bacterium]